jgi:vitamin B12 transporter
VESLSSYARQFLGKLEKPEIYRNMHIGNNVGAEANASYISKLGTTGMGAEFRKEFLQSNNLGERERAVTTLFLEHHFSLINNKLTLSPGISLANYSGNDNFFYPGLDVGYAVNENHKLYGNIGKVNRVPTFTDLYYVSSTEQGNANLQPESAISYELGYRFSKNNWLAKASLFGRNSENAIDFVKNTPAEKWNAQNIGNIDTKGLELEVKKTMNTFIKSYSVGYTFLENEIQLQVPLSRYVSDNFKHQLIGKLENKFGKYFSNQLIYRYQQRVDGQSYHLLDEKLTFNYKNVDLFLLINNVTNTKYTETFGVPMPNRWFHVGVSYEIPFN